jgi:hypothetical protein
VRIVLDLPDELAADVKARAVELNASLEDYLLYVVEEDVALAQRGAIDQWDPTAQIDAMSLAGRVKELRVQSASLGRKLEGLRQMGREEFEAQVNSLFG